MPTGRLKVKARLAGALLERPLVRRFLYRHTDSLGPLRGLTSSAVWGYRAALLETGVGMWGDEVGVLYDLGHRLRSQGEQDAAMEAHYVHTITQLRRALQRVNPASIIDYGCGPGILTEHLAEAAGDRSIKIVGAEIRAETMSNNRRLRPDIEWQMIGDVPTSNHPEPRLFVLDGVVNYMSVAEIEEVLALGEAFVFFYAAEDDDPGDPIIAGFDLFEMLHRAGLRESSVVSIDRGEDGPNHVSCSAFRATDPRSMSE